MSSNLPNESDFDPFDGCLDAQWAWKNFGGLELPEAYELFCENPLHYSEDFMWMGHAALAYYFPVLDQYLRAGDEEEQSRIIASSLLLQFGYDDTSKIDHLKPSVHKLADFIIKKAGNPAKHNDISDEWTKLKEHLGPAG